MTFKFWMRYLSLSLAKIFNPNFGLMMFQICLNIQMLSDLITAESQSHIYTNIYTQMSVVGSIVTYVSNKTYVTIDPNGIRIVTLFGSSSK